MDLNSLVNDMPLAVKIPAAIIAIAAALAPFTPNKSKSKILQLIFTLINMAAMNFRKSKNDPKIK